MAYGGSGNRRQPRRDKLDNVRLTGLFPSRNKRGLFVGTARVEELKALVPKLKQALADEVGLVFFLWRNQEAEEGQPAFNLTAAVAQERPDSKPARGKSRRDAELENDEGEPEPDDDLPF